MGLELIETIRIDGSNDREFISFRIEIGSVSRSSKIEIGSFFVTASNWENRSNYSLGSFEYWVQDFDAEVFVELERINENRAQSDEVSVSVGGAAAGDDGDEPTKIVIENLVRAESDEAAQIATHLYSRRGNKLIDDGNLSYCLKRDTVLAQTIAY
ncbi:hypothetical protein C5167_017661 [Papaver somniferum]|uniref:Uncharacterized protein n=1 Tax=Papaver somniferum TaxID=3469 RepID=A0A4Y7IKK9_PAPSO|nr:hypothetical protein C5167_017661 [Papaver somniferum]